jgi:hypothetical protein
MPYIWRVEDDSYAGPYQEGPEDLSERHNGTPDHPTPFTDNGINRMPEEYEVCGFKNLKQAKAWFNEADLAMLDEAGFKLKRVPVAKITAVGQKQVLAVRSERYDDWEADYGRR